MRKPSMSKPLLTDGQKKELSQSLLKIKDAIEPDRNKKEGI